MENYSAIIWAEDLHQQFFDYRGKSKWMGCCNLSFNHLLRFEQAFDDWLDYFSQPFPILIQPGIYLQIVSSYF